MHYQNSSLTPPPPLQPVDIVQISKISTILAWHPLDNVVYARLLLLVLPLFLSSQFCVIYQLWILIQNIHYTWKSSELTFLYWKIVKEQRTVRSRAFHKLSHIPNNKPHWFPLKRDNWVSSTDVKLLQQQYNIIILLLTMYTKTIKLIKTLYFIIITLRFIYNSKIYSHTVINSVM